MSLSFKCGFIGYGNMASALISGILENHIIDGRSLAVYDSNSAKTSGLDNIKVCADIGELADFSDIIFLCVKPNMIQTVSSEINAEGKAVVSIAAGVRADDLYKYLPDGTRVMRIMPNTPLMVGKGAICVQKDHDFKALEREFVYDIFSHLGIVEEVDGALMDAVTGISGSGPAYVYLFMDSMAQAGQKNGLEYSQALRLAIQTFEGACEMLKKTGKSPSGLIDDVCSPGGTTLAAMEVFYKRETPAIIGEAVDRCVERSKELSGAK